MADRRRLLVFGFVLLRQAHVALGVDGIVEMPVGHRSTGETDLEQIGGFKHGMERHVSPVAPTPDADALGVYPWLLLEPSHAIPLVGKLRAAKMVMSGFFEDVAATGGAAIIQREN